MPSKLTANERKVLGALQDLGEAAATQISFKSGVKFGETIDALRELRKQKLVISFKRAGKFMYSEL